MFERVCNTYPGAVGFFTVVDLIVDTSVCAPLPPSVLIVESRLSYNLNPLYERSRLARLKIAGCLKIRFCDIC